MESAERMLALIDVVADRADIVLFRDLVVVWVKSSVAAPFQLLRESTYLLWMEVVAFFEMVGAFHGRGEDLGDPWIRLPVRGRRGL